MSTFYSRCNNAPLELLILRLFVFQNRKTVFRILFAASMTNSLKGKNTTSGDFNARTKIPKLSNETPIGHLTLCYLSWPVVDHCLIMKLPIFIILSLLTISSQAFRPRSRFADQVRSIETPQILDTFSLSWQGDLGLSQVVGGVSKIVEGFASCKFNVQLFPN